MKNGTNAYGEWVKAFKESMFHDVEPVSLVDYNVKTILDYAQEIGLSREEAERAFAPWVVEGYRRAHARAVEKFKSASLNGCLISMERAFCDVVDSGGRIGIKRDDLERRYGYAGIEVEREKRTNRRIYQGANDESI